MKKKKNFNVVYPEPVSADKLALWDEDELFNRLQTLESEKAQVASNGYNPFHWEVELAWTQRETNLRKERRFRHEKYVAENAVVLDDAWALEGEVNEYEFAN